MITPQILQQFSRSLTILYVEDDLQLREETVETLGYFFDKITTASDGEEGIAKYREGIFDIVISDISMPRKNGIEMIREIKAIRKNQQVIVTSAHGDETILMQLIDIGITKFVQKPIRIDPFLELLYEVCKSIDDSVLLENYRKQLELVNNQLLDSLKRLDSQNSELSELNHQLKKYARVLFTKLKDIDYCKAHYEVVLKKISGHTGNQPIKVARKSHQERLLVDKDDADELAEIVSDVDCIVNYSIVNQKISHDLIQELADILSRYGTVLNHYDICVELGAAVRSLAHCFRCNQDKIILDYHRVMEYLESFVFVLVQWHTESVHGTVSPHIYHSSMMADITMFIAYIEGNLDSIESEIELF